MKQPYGFLVIDTYLNTVRCIPNHYDEVYKSLNQLYHQNKVKQHKTRAELDKEIRRYLNKEYDEED